MVGVLLPRLTDDDSEAQAGAGFVQSGRQGGEQSHRLPPEAPPSALDPSGGRGGPWGRGPCLSAGAGAEVGEGQKLFCLPPCHLTVPPHLLREKGPKEKPSKPALWQPRQGPTDEAQMAAAAALARLEQKQPRARGPTSQESIRSQGEPRPSLGHGVGYGGRWSGPLPLCPRG